ncbi:sel1 repeat family protein [Campylobacter fetus]|uniref:Beta-lactamase n=1 Tax=Campylobacter fetus subsp. testudinum TaxID=1507806 RepID=A0AAX0HDM5_CAMFE|nr:sel1 repeat family protein [Campylobacter fetus]OCR85828.1 hypothetical protein CFT12S05168_02385 [Campylobacter fetus subsp. testudinum]OCR91512.1 hypothetical protein CFT12S02225_00155 [Campylobacter fetus subsp. testudinum]
MFKYMTVVMMLVSLTGAEESIKSLKNKCMNKHNIISCIMLADNPKVPQNKKTEYHIQACELGHTASCESVGAFYVMLYQNTQNKNILKLARAYYSKACSKETFSACSVLGFIYVEMADKDSAINTFRKGCSLYDLDSCSVLTKLGDTSLPAKIYDELNISETNKENSYEYSRIKCLNRQNPAYYCKKVVEREITSFDKSKYIFTRNKEQLLEIRRFVITYCIAQGFRDRMEDCSMYNEFRKAFLE